MFVSKVSESTQPVTYYKSFTIVIYDCNDSGLYYNS